MTILHERAISQLRAIFAKLKGMGGGALLGSAAIRSRLRAGHVGDAVGRLRRFNRAKLKLARLRHQVEQAKVTGTLVPRPGPQQAPKPGPQVTIGKKKPKPIVARLPKPRPTQMSPIPKESIMDLGQTLAEMSDAGRRAMFARLKQRGGSGLLRSPAVKQALRAKLALRGSGVWSPTPDGRIMASKGQIGKLGKGELAVFRMVDAGGMRALRLKVAKGNRDVTIIARPPYSIGPRSVPATTKAAGKLRDPESMSGFGYQGHGRGGLSTTSVKGRRDQEQGGRTTRRTGQSPLGAAAKLSVMKNLFKKGK